MRVLWICNIVLPLVARVFNLQVSLGGGWLEAMMPYLLLDRDIELTVAGPADGRSYQQRDIVFNLGDFVDSEDLLEEEKKRTVTGLVFGKEMEDLDWLDLLSEVRPDVIHLQGTEYPYGYRLMKLAPQYKYVTSLQGILSFYAKHFTACLPHKVVYGKRLYDLIKRDSIHEGQEKFLRGGVKEQKLLEGSAAVIGRTEWDRTCAYFLSPQTPYYHCGENLRSSFYHNSWRYDDCELHSIFISQANYPIKGFHMFLQGLPYILREFPDTKVYVAGHNRIFPRTFKEKLCQNYYMHYLQEQIMHLNLKKSIVFTGPLNEKEMVDRLLASHVFVLPSVIENSPNSLGEAMLLGVPAVTANVGGVNSMVEDEREGLLYPFEEPYMMAAKIIRIFKEADLAGRLSEMARIKASQYHNRLKNARDTVAVYRRIGENCE